MSRFASEGRVHLWEEPLFENQAAPTVRLSAGSDGVRVLTPLLPRGYSDEQAGNAQRTMLDQYLTENKVQNFVAWYYTPMALRFSEHLKPVVTVYDCMDELSAFQGAPPELVGEEQRLFARADVVFAGGASLYASKKTQHGNAHLFPSSIDYAHFAVARRSLEDPADQAGIAHPRIGFYGVLDERLDRELLRDVAVMRHEWQLILVGPVVKIRQEDLPRAQNLHYVGQKSYGELPAYLGNWDVAMLPFARNASTRFISPTKTPEYLAAGKPVVSTPINDVVKPYGDLGLVFIGETADEFVRAIEKALSEADERWLERVDAQLAENSWDKTFQGMRKEIERIAPFVPARSAAVQQ